MQLAFEIAPGPPEVPEADRLGIKASDEEVRQRIFSAPAFQLVISPLGESM